MADIQVANTDADLSGNTVVTEENAYTITGLHTYSRSTNAPFACISGAAVVTYLDADKLDGQEGAYYLAAANITGTTLASNVVTSSLTAVGTIATGVWQGTDVGVAYGGTGVSTLADGYVLLGSGTGAITTLDVTADGAILIGDGSGDPTTLDVGSSSGITILGTIATGVWNGTAVTVAYGGTGASTLTDGGVLLGSGTGAITAMSVLADSEMIVGNGSTDPVAESGSTLRTSIGVGTGDSPTFTGLTAAQVDITGDLVVNTSTLFVDASEGAVGIGTASPSSDLDIDKATVGGETGIQINNTDNTNAASNAVLDIRVGGSSAGDPYLVFQEPSTTAWTIGIDNSDSDKLKIANQTGVGGNEIITFQTNGNVGISTASPDTGLHYVGDELKFQGNNPFFAFYSLSTGARLGYLQAHESGNFALGSDKSGTDMAFSTNSGNFTFTGGNVSISGSLSKGSGSFKINHPLSSKSDTHFLVHSFIEGPRADLLYRGTATLASGSATVDLDTAAGMTTGTWVVLCRDAQVFTSNESGWDAVRGSMSGSTLTIECQDAASTDTVSWMVVAERKDQHMYDTEWTDAEGHAIVEPEKPAEEEEP